MSVYVGIDIHRKCSQVAVIDQGGEVLANRNVPNGVEPILRVIGGLPAGGLPAGTLAAYEATFGWGWLPGAAGRLPRGHRRWPGADDALQQPTGRLDAEVRQRAKADPRVKVLTQLPGGSKATQCVGAFRALRGGA